MKLIACLVVIAALVAAPAMADDLSLATDLAKAYGISEIRAGVMMDDFELYSTAPIWFVPQADTFHAQNIDTVSVDVLFNPLHFDGFLNKPGLGVLDWVLHPRPTVGFDLNFKHESVLHASLNWHVPVGTTRFFIEPEFGGSLNNADLNAATRPPGWRNVGCNALFYWAINIGYEIDEHWDIMATEQHSSHGGLCNPADNQGINYTGIRIGYKF